MLKQESSTSCRADASLSSEAANARVQTLSIARLKPVVDRIC